MDERLKELKHKISFLYEINGKIYAIGHNKVFDCSYSKVVAPGLKSSIEIYKKDCDLLENKINENDEIEIAKIMFQIVLLSNNEISLEENKEKILDIQLFWDKLNDVEKNLLFKQMETFKYMFKKVKFNIRYPDVMSY